MNSVIKHFWKTLSKDRFMVLLDCVTNDYISRYLTTEETSFTLDLTRAAAASQTFDELGKALKVTSDQVAEMLEIPADVISEWEISGIPEYQKKMITAAIASYHIDQGRRHACHRCGRSFINKDPKEVMCETCKYQMSVGILERYIQFRIHGNND